MIAGMTGDGIAGTTEGIAGMGAGIAGTTGGITTGKSRKAFATG
jgi:hypothetical protein